MDSKQTNVGDTWSKQQEWYIRNIIEILNEIKEDVLILNERITKWEKEKEKKH